MLIYQWVRVGAVPLTYAAMSVSTLGVVEFYPSFYSIEESNKAIAQD